MRLESNDNANEIMRCSILNLKHCQTSNKSHIISLLHNRHGKALHIWDLHWYCHVHSQTSVSISFDMLRNRREARQQNKPSNRNTPVMEGDMTVRERKRGRLPYQTPQDWDYFLHQSAIAQQKWTGNNTVKPSVYLNTRRSIKYKSSSQHKCITGICSVKIKSYMCSYKIFIYMLWWYVIIDSNIGISRVVSSERQHSVVDTIWTEISQNTSNFDTTVKIYMLLNKVLNLVIKVKLHTHAHTHTHTHTLNFNIF